MIIIYLNYGSTSDRGPRSVKGHIVPVPKSLRSAYARQSKGKETQRGELSHLRSHSRSVAENRIQIQYPGPFGHNTFGILIRSLPYQPKCKGHIPMNHISRLSRHPAFGGPISVRTASQNAPKSTSPLANSDISSLSFYWSMGTKGTSWHHPIRS